MAVVRFEAAMRTNGRSSATVISAPQKRDDFRKASSSRFGFIAQA